MNNKITIKDIYIDKITNESRWSFKIKLTYNEYRKEEEEEVSSKNVHKLKSNKAKIKKFKSKNDSETEAPKIQPKKITAHNIKDNPKNKNEKIPKQGEKCHSWLWI